MSRLGRNSLWVAVGVVLNWFATLAAAPQGSESPTEAVRGTVTRVISILEDPALKAPAKLIPHRRMLEEVIAGRFDYAEMSKRVLAAEWTPLVEAQHTDFVELFKRFLSADTPKKSKVIVRNKWGISQNGSKRPMPKSEPSYAQTKRTFQWTTALILKAGPVTRL